jgi:hypothetical protein
MRIIKRKRQPERLIDSASDSLGELRDGLTKSRLLKAGLIAGGLTVLTAGSAGISSLRRRIEGHES